MKAKKHIRIPSFDILLWWPDGETARRLARWFLPNPGTLILIGVLIWVQLAGAAPWARPALQTGGSSATTINYQGQISGQRRHADQRPRHDGVLPVRQRHGRQPIVGA